LTAPEQFVKDVSGAAAAENLAENLERIVEPARPTRSGSHARVKGGVAVLVIGGALLRLA
jgi:hypothetical protein